MICIVWGWDGDNTRFFQNQDEENLYLIMDKGCFLDIKGGQRSEANKIELYFKVKNFFHQREEEWTKNNPLQ